MATSHALLMLARRLACALLLAAFAWPTLARADEVAPTLEPNDLRSFAEAELERLVQTLEPAAAARLTGIYVAFQPDDTHPFALSACDDDGDYVIVLSDAMLRLVANVARASALDEEDPGGGGRLAAYAAHLGASQREDARLLPLLAGTFDGAFDPSERGARVEARLRETLSFLLARELGRLRAGQLVCPRPTATRESGDRIWTASEQRTALAVARVLYAARGPLDDDAIARVLDVGHTEGGAARLLELVAALQEAPLARPRGRWTMPYAGHYPAARAAALRVREAAKLSRRRAEDLR